MNNCRGAVQLADYDIATRHLLTHTGSQRRNPTQILRSDTPVGQQLHHLPADRLSLNGSKGTFPKLSRRKLVGWVRENPERVPPVTFIKRPSAERRHNSLREGITPAPGVHLAVHQLLTFT